jgi:hypothetical protein
MSSLQPNRSIRSVDGLKPLRTPDLRQSKIAPIRTGSKSRVIGAPKSAEPDVSSGCVAGGRMDLAGLYPRPFTPALVVSI